MKKNILICCFVVFIIIISAYPGIAETQNISLVNGFNCIALTVDATGITAKSLIEQNNNIVSVFMFDPDNQVFKFNVKLANGSILGEEIVISGGKGYFINSDGTGTLSFTGNATSYGSTLSLKKGFNLIGFPEIPLVSKASSLISNYSDVDKVFLFDGAKQQFGYMINLGSSTLGDEINFVKGTGYFIELKNALELPIPSVNPDAAKAEQMAKAVVSTLVRNGATASGAPSYIPEYSSLPSYTGPDENGYYTINYSYVIVDPGTSQSVTYNYISKIRLLAGSKPITLGNLITSRSTLSNAEMIMTYSSTNNESGNVSVTFSNLSFPGSLVAPYSISGNFTFNGTYATGSYTATTTGSGTGSLVVTTNPINFVPYYNATFTCSDNTGVSTTINFGTNGAYNATMYYGGQSIGTIGMAENGTVTYADIYDDEIVKMADFLYTQL